MCYDVTIVYITFKNYEASFRHLLDAISYPLKWLRMQGNPDTMNDAHKDSIRCGRDSGLDRRNTLHSSASSSASSSCNIMSRTRSLRSYTLESCSSKELSSMIVGNPQ